ncbi:hypothetical protein Zmor_018808 [Zophobas morio]|uniref:Uncharacterized protein n=1 Tax=Zophobas morio TaxID=2755281 RepID=A0AA38MDH7_9CUCU|nr:hypothetical protein Zmor_018808 [Zophobas morio]
MYLYIFRIVVFWQLQKSVLSNTSSSINYIVTDSDDNETPQNGFVIFSSQPLNAVSVTDKVATLFKGLFSFSYPVDILRIQNCSVVEIDPDFLYGQEITNLHIIRNNIKVIRTHSFRNLVLKSIDLSKNGILAIEDMAFVNLSNLEEIRLSTNKLTVFNSRAFASLPKLHLMSLMTNKISHLGPSSLDFVQKNNFALHLLYNRITYIDDNVFKGLSVEDVAITLDKNLLEEISVNIFHNHTFDLVSLRKNKIRTLTGNLSAQNFRIKLMDIDDTIDKKAFKQIQAWTAWNNITLECWGCLSETEKNFAQPLRLQNSFLMVFCTLVYKCLSGLC